ncbi:MAG: hypothetical protein ACN6OP_29200 [Pseudomonadales bacterium]
MSKYSAGVVVVGESVTVVHAEVPSDPNDPIIIISDSTFKLQTGERGDALAVMYARCVDLFTQTKTESTVIKASALSMSGMKLAALASAEVRGVVIAAAASKTAVKILAKSRISKTYGERKVDEYLADDSLWADKAVGIKLKKSSREAAMLIIASRNS